MVIRRLRLLVLAKRTAYPAFVSVALMVPVLSSVPVTPVLK